MTNKNLDLWLAQTHYVAKSFKKMFKVKPSNISLIVGMTYSLTDMKFNNSK